ncbi:BCCT family transporter [Alkalibacter mobilis]|uniref:BCCT family transporter n=1 Tax=Alkalibacter mobilis TaxID=2787712 RepID=UPI0018A00639|nr:BCCT family transporter [Alkalibacter mobilis]MBF7096820.1 BCCT family transporter [Alkalibacter mobilis]
MIEKVKAEGVQKDQYDVKTDKTIFIGALFIIVLVCGVSIVFPETTLSIVEKARVFIITKFDWFFLAIGLASLIISIYLGAGRYGKIKLSEIDEKPEFSYFSWLFMIYFSAIGSSTLMWAICEPLAIISDPPFGFLPFSEEAYFVSIPYGMFHWGPIAWSFFALPGLVVSYCFYKRKKKRLQISSVLSDVIGKKNSEGIFGKIIDIASIFFTFCTFGPSLGFGVPVLTQLISNVTGLPSNDYMQYAVLAVWTMIFTCSVYRGLTKGIKVLSDINMWLLALLLIMVFFVSDPLYILRSIVEQSGELVSNFVRMATYSDVFNNGSFARDWTVFYWSWWMVEIPFMSIFIARVSKGRSFRELLFGIIGAGSIGTMSVFWVLGNYGLKLQKTGAYDLAGIYNTRGSTMAVVETMNSLPYHEIISIVMILLYFVFLATCIDSGSFTMGCMASKEIKDYQQPSKINRATWAVTIALIGVAILRLGGGLAAIQTIIIIVGLPSAVLLILLVAAIFKWLKEDYPQNYS